MIFALMSLAMAESPAHLDLLAGTTLPTEVGARLQTELPYRIRLGVHGAWLPPAYVDLINEISVAAGWYGEPTAALVSETLDDAFILGVDLGWRPLPKHGFFFGAGYQAAVLGGGLTSIEALEAASGGTYPGLRTDSFALEVDSTLHMVTADLGWEQVWFDQLVLRVTLGGAFTVHSTSRVAPDGREATPVTQAFYDEGAAYLNDTYQSYVHTPTIGVYLGYRFF